MAAPSIFRSSDTGAPTLNGVAGSLISVLDACLVDGYGSTFATGSFIGDGVIVNDGDTVTIGSTVYTYRTTISGQPPYTVAIAAAVTALDNLVAAINGTGTVGTSYTAGTDPHPSVWALPRTGTTVPLSARTGGTSGNSIALSESSAHLTSSGSTLSGGGGSNSKTALGWSKDFTATNRATYRAPAGVRHYLDVDDSASNATALGRSAVIRGFETMTAVGTGSGQFPNTSLAAAGVGPIPKSDTLSGAGRTWLLIGDERGFYFFNSTTVANPPVLSTHTWPTNWAFGEIESFLVGDNYRTMIAMTTLTPTSFVDNIGLNGPTLNNTSSDATRTFLARTYTGFGGSVWAAYVFNVFYPCPPLGRKSALSESRRRRRVPVSGAGTRAWHQPHLARSGTKCLRHSRSRSRPLPVRPHLVHACRSGHLLR